MAALSLALNVPGQVSMDTSVQLFEAHVGHSVSWNPPFMSALLAWMGGGKLATSLFVLLCVGLLYGSFAIVVINSLRRETGQKSAIQMWRVGIAAVLLLNPVIFIYSGIIWKDTLFASFLAATVALIAVATSVRNTRVQWMSVACAVVALSIGTLTRQQGLVIAFPLLCAIALSSLPGRTLHRKHAALQVVGILVAFAIAVSQLGAATNRTIHRSDDRGFSVGFRNVFIYDIAGIVFYEGRNDSGIGNALVPEDIQQTIKLRYSPFRLDFLLNNTTFRNWALQMKPRRLFGLWWRLVSRHPLAYATHRMKVFGALLDLNGVRKCLPIHVGVSGNPTYLKAIGMSAGTGRRGQFLYRLESHFFHTPLFEHWFNGIWVICLFVGIFYARLGRQEKLTLALIALGALLVLLSYLPTSIACDYRYLFSLIPIATLISLWLLLRPRSDLAATSLRPFRSTNVGKGDVTQRGDATRRV